MNDSAYTYDISKNLIAVGETLFISRDEHEVRVARELALDDDELSTLEPKA